MASEVEKKLYKAASNGDVTALVHLLEEDPYLVHGVLFPYSRNLLHIAAIHGQTSIVEEVLNLDPQLACISDSQKSTPLHIAAARGHVEIASILLSKAPEMCWRRDDQGMNPVHVAAMNGHVEILEHLLEASCFPAMERLHRGQTVLHLCVKHGQLTVLKVLVDKLGDLVCTKDDDGDTLLHLAVRCNQNEIVEYLVGIKVLKQETRNGMGKTAVQILNEGPPTTYEYSHMKCMLTEEEKFSFFEALPEMSSNIMVVAVLIATMAFQAMISPPGGVWAEDDAKSSRKAGEAVMAFYHPKAYRCIVRTNLMAFFCSLVTITMFLFHAVVQPHYLHVMVSMFGMGGALIAIFVTFTVSLTTISPDEVMRSTGNKIMGVAMFGLLALWVCFLVVRRLYLFWLKKKSRQQDLSADAFPLRVFYWIFDKLETRGYLRAAGRFQVL